MAKNSMLIIVPVLNEANNIFPLLKKIFKYLKNKKKHILFIDDNSTDGTIEKAKELGFEVIHQKNKNKGEGNACRIGTDATQSDFVMFFSPDGNDLPEDIPKLIEKAKEGYDVVHISRFGKNSVSEDANWIERFGNYMFTFLVNTFFGAKYTDALNGFRIIKRELWDELKTDAQYLNIEQQTCIRLAKRKIPIYEIESIEPNRIGGERKMRPLPVGGMLSYQIIKEFIFWK